MGRLIAALALVTAACGGAAAPATDAGTTPPPATAEGSVTDTAGPASPTTDAPQAAEQQPEPTAETSRPRPEGPDAPDFTLALGEGGEFTLSAEQKPVYLVFWAEW